MGDKSQGARDSEVWTCPAPDCTACLCFACHLPCSVTWFLAKHKAEQLNNDKSLWVKTSADKARNIKEKRMDKEYEQTWVRVDVVVNMKMRFDGQEQAEGLTPDNAKDYRLASCARAPQICYAHGQKLRMHRSAPL